MKKALSILTSFILVLSVVALLSSCGGTGNGGPDQPGKDYEVTLQLSGGVKFTVKSPVPVTCTAPPPAGSYPDGWSKVDEVLVTGNLGSGQKMTVTFEDPAGFDANDKIGYVDGAGRWMPVDSNIKLVGKARICIAFNTGLLQH